MKQKLFKILKNKMILAIIATSSLSAVMLPSCTKSSSGSSSSTNYNAAFLGTWTNSSNSCGGASGTTTFSAGSNGNSFTLPGTVGGSASCLKSIVVTCVASNATTFTIPSTNYTDNCGLSYTIAGGGTLSGNSMTVTLIATGAATGTCTSTLTK